MTAVGGAVDRPMELFSKRNEAVYLPNFQTKLFMALHVLYLLFVFHKHDSLTFFNSLCFDDIT